MATLKFGAFPRSGSHFFTGLTDCEWLDHKIKPLGIEQNVVVSIRNPLQCVPSWIVLTADRRANRAERTLEWYRAYYTACKNVDVVVLPFAQLISEPLHCVNHARARYGLEPLHALNYDLTTGFHYPTKDKSAYSGIIEEMRVAPSFEPAMSLFEALCVPVG